MGWETSPFCSRNLSCSKTSFWVTVKNNLSFSGMLFFGDVLKSNRINLKGSGYDMLWLMKFHSMNEYILTDIVVVVFFWRSYCLYIYMKTTTCLQLQKHLISSGVGFWIFVFGAHELGSPPTLKGLPLSFTGGSKVNVVFLGCQLLEPHLGEVSSRSWKIWEPRAYGIIVLEFTIFATRFNYISILYGWPSLLTITNPLYYILSRVWITRVKKNCK